MSVGYWTAFDVRDLLPTGWKDAVGDVALEHAVVTYHPRTPALSREAPDVHKVHRGEVDPQVVGRELGWLQRLYRSAFAELAEYVADELVRPCRDDFGGITLTLQTGTDMRQECLVGAHPLTGLLLCTTHAEGHGGETVLALDPRAASVEEVEKDCCEVRPEAGRLVFYDPRLHPHYVRALNRSDQVRIAAVLTYYTESNPEPAAPPDKDR